MLQTCMGMEMRWLPFFLVVTIIWPPLVCTQDVKNQYSLSTLVAAALLRGNEGPFFNDPRYLSLFHETNQQSGASGTSQNGGGTAFNFPLDEGTPDSTNTAPGPSTKNQVNPQETAYLMPLPDSTLSSENRGGQMINNVLTTGPKTSDGVMAQTNNMVSLNGRPPGATSVDTIPHTIMESSMPMFTAAANLKASLNEPNLNPNQFGYTPPLIPPSSSQLSTNAMEWPFEVGTDLYQNMWPPVAPGLGQSLSSVDLLTNSFPDQAMGLPAFENGLGIPSVSVPSNAMDSSLPSQNQITFRSRNDPFASVQNNPMVNSWPLQNQITLRTFSDPFASVQNNPMVNSQPIQDQMTFRTLSDPLASVPNYPGVNSQPTQSQMTFGPPQNTGTSLNLSPQLYPSSQGYLPSTFETLPSSMSAPSIVSGATNGQFDYAANQLNVPFDLESGNLLSTASISSGNIPQWQNTNQNMNFGSDFHVNALDSSSSYFGATNTGSPIVYQPGTRPLGHTGIAMNNDIMLSGWPYSNGQLLMPYAIPISTHASPASSLGPSYLHTLRPTSKFSETYSSGSFLKLSGASPSLSFPEVYQSNLYSTQLVPPFSASLPSQPTAFLTPHQTVYQPYLQYTPMVHNLLPDNSINFVPLQQPLTFVPQMPLWTTTHGGHIAPGIGIALVTTLLLLFFG